MINMELRMSPSKFNMTAIITAMDSITADELKNFLLDNLSTFDKGSKFTIFGGHHHSGPTNEKPTLENVHVDEYDLTINYNHHKVWICCVIYAWIISYSKCSNWHRILKLLSNFGCLFTFCSFAWPN